MTDIGVVRGRFQVFHLKHLEYILAAKMRCRKLLIGIEEPERIFRKEKNPFTYYERFEMIHDSLIDFGIRRDEFEIIPFPCEHPERILNYVPQHAEFYLNICDEDDRRLLHSLEEMGLKTEVLLQKTPETKGITSSEVRMCILTGQEWRTLVPKKVYEYIMCYHLDERMIAYQKYLEEQTLFEAVSQLEEEEVYREEIESYWGKFPVWEEAQEEMQEEVHGTIPEEGTEENTWEKTEKMFLEMEEDTGLNPEKNVGTEIKQEEETQEF